MAIIYLTDDYKGGANKFLEQNIQYNLLKKNKVVVFNKNFIRTFPNIKKNKNLKFFDLDIFDQKNQIKKKIKTFEKKKKYFFLQIMLY